MIPARMTILHGLLICLPFTLFVIITFSKWPRLWLHSLPPDIAAMAGPKTPEEVKQTRLLVIPVLLILPGLSFASALYAATRLGIDLSFLGAVRHIYGIWVIVHLWDLVVIDWGYALIMDPQRPPIAGTAGARGYRDYAFHFRAFVRAVIMSALGVLPLSLIASVVA